MLHDFFVLEQFCLAEFSESPGFRCVVSLLKDTSQTIAKPHEVHKNTQKQHIKNRLRFDKDAWKKKIFPKC